MQVAEARFDVAGRGEAACGMSPWELIPPNVRSYDCGDNEQGCVGGWDDRVGQLTSEAVRCEGDCYTHVTFGATNNEGA
eukprot:SAG11_NODE_34327_length_272_cov_1.196532_1_plen_78_part_01